MISELDAAGTDSDWIGVVAHHNIRFDERQDDIAAHIRRHHPEAQINYSNLRLSGAA